MSKQYPGGIISKTPVTPSGPYATSTASGIWTLDQQAYWQKLGQWPTAGNFPIDPQFNYVTMLLHGDGTNGAQNNTFLDSSTNNFTITRNGNTTQGSFSPYGSNWSNYFNGSSDYLSLGTSTNLALGAGDFTIEVWLSVTAYNASTSNIFEWRSAGGTPSNIPTLYLSASGVPIFYASVGAGALITGSSAVALNTWTHLAIVRSGSTVTMYLNGTSVGSATNSANLGTQSFYINDPQGTFRHNGYFSNVRMVKGTAVYTGSFTPSTTPLTAITNTQLLTCQSNRFVDNSANAFSSTITGTPSVQRFNPFGASTAYSTSVIGGSGYFDGSGDYLATSSTQIIPASTTYTVEAWVYLTGDYSDYREIVTQGSSGNANRWLMLVNITDGELKIQTGSSSIPTSFTVPKNTWTHLAFVNNSGSYTVYANGTSVGSGTNTVTPQNTYLTVGAFQSGAEYFQGYISNVRITNTAVYTSAFTPNTAPLTAISGTSLLLLTTNGAIFDNAMMNDLETVGNAQISTSVKKYGTGSLAFDGTAGYLKVNKSIPQNIFAGNFTIEFWFNVNGTSGYKRMFNNAPGTTPSGYFYIFYNGTDIRMYNDDVGVLITVGTFTANTWTFLAISRSGSTTRVFVNGTQTYSYSGTTFFLSNDFYIGGGPDQEYTNGYIDDFRITAGYARYTANFTPPTAALFDYGPT
jgi:hypothetical protein